MEDKKATAGLTWEYLADRVKRHGLPAFGIGAGLAGVVQLLALKKDMEENAAKKKDEDVITIEIPEKKAAAPGQYIWDAPVALAAGIGGLSAGYMIVDSLLRKMRQKQTEDKLDSLKSQYAHFLAEDLSPKRGSEYPMLHGVAMGMAEFARKLPAPPTEKIAGVSPETLGSMFTSLPGIAALVTGLLAHNYYYSRGKSIQRALEKEEVSNVRRAPKTIRIVSVPAKILKDSDSPKGQEEEDFGDMLEPKKGSSAVETAKKILDAEDEDQKKKEDEGAPKPENKKDRVYRRTVPLMDEKDISQLDRSTLIISTDDGDVQVDALDPEAMKALEKHKEQILRDFALGVNLSE